MISKSIIGKLLIDIGTRILHDECELDEDECNEVFLALGHKKMDIEQVCHHYGISRATLDRKIKNGEFPAPHKELGGKKYFWYDEIETKIHSAN